MSYIVIHSVHGGANKTVAECDTFEDAVAAAREAGATGEPEPLSRNGQWCFTGGPESIGFWIEDIG